MVFQKVTPVAAFHNITSRVRASAQGAGRALETVNLIAVSKTFSKEDIMPLLCEGHRHFGENRIQEALDKWPELRREVKDIVLHMIGPLQTNKVRDAIEHFNVIHSVDRSRLAERLAVEMKRQDRRPLCLIQVNTGREPQKAGIDPADADAFIDYCRHKLNLPVKGLMCIPPAHEEPSLHFAFLREIALRNDLAHLSMGMSADFETAISFGATYVRVGSAIFGSRGLP